MSLLSTKLHGVLDYTTAAKMLIAPRLLRYPAEVRQVMAVAGVATAAYSLATRYELGVWKLLPMKAHLALDVLNGVFFLAAPVVFPDAPRSVRATLVGLGLFEIAAALATESEPSAAGEIAQLRDYTGDALASSTEAAREDAVGA
jgi:hypothetical protein